MYRKKGLECRYTQVLRIRLKIFILKTFKLRSTFLKSIDCHIFSSTNPFTSVKFIQFLFYPPNRQMVRVKEEKTLWVFQMEPMIKSYYPTLTFIAYIRNPVTPILHLRGRNGKGGSRSNYVSGDFGTSSPFLYLLSFDPGTY